MTPRIYEPLKAAKACATTVYARVPLKYKFKPILSIFGKCAFIGNVYYHNNYTYMDSHAHFCV